MVEKGRKKIFIVDDGRSSSLMIKNTLEPLGCEVLSVADPEECVGIATAFNPDLIFVSLELQGSNGLKVSNGIHLTDGLKDVPVVMMISYDGELDPKYTSTIGVVDVIVKPLKDTEIISLILGILGENSLSDDYGSSADEVSQVGMETGEEPFAVATDWREAFDFEEERTGGPNVGNNAPDLFPEPSAHETEEIADNDDTVTPEHINETVSPGDEMLLDKPTEDRKDNKDNDESGGQTSDFETVVSETVREKEKSVPPPGGVAARVNEGDKAIHETEPELFPSDPQHSTKKNAIAGVIFVLLAAFAAGAYFAWKAFYPAPVNQTVITERPLQSVQQEVSPAPTAGEKSGETAPVAAPAVPEKNVDKTVHNAAEDAIQGKNVPEKAETGKTVAQKPVSAKTASQKAASGKVGAKESKKTAAASRQAAGKKPAKEQTAAGNSKKKGPMTYSAQAGVFSGMKNAQLLVIRLENSGFKPFILKDTEARLKKGKIASPSGSKTVYRVLVGKFKSDKKAVEQIRALRKVGYDAVMYRS